MQLVNVVNEAKWIMEDGLWKVEGETPIICIVHNNFKAKNITKNAIDIMAKALRNGFEPSC